MKKASGCSDPPSKQMQQRNLRDTYVLHRPLPEGNVILRSGLSRSSLRFAVTRWKTSSNLAALYLVLLPSPNLKVEKVRGCPNTSSPRLLYSSMQSGTVIRNLPNIMAISLQEVSVQVKEGLGCPQKAMLTLQCLSHRYGRNNDTVRTCELPTWSGISHRGREPFRLSSVHQTLVCVRRCWAIDEDGNCE